jgi:hypothetical protein
MKQILLTCLFPLTLFSCIRAQSVHVAAEVFTNAIAAIVFTSDEYGRVIDHKLYEGSDLPEEGFVSLSTGSVAAPYHLSVILRARTSPSYLLVNPTRAVTFWHNEQDTIWTIEQTLPPESISKRREPGRFHLLITHKSQPKTEVLRQFALLNFKGNKFDFETSPCWNYNLRKIGNFGNFGNFGNDGTTSVRFDDSNEQRHIFHLQSDDDDRYRELLIPAYVLEKDNFVADYQLLVESGSPFNISLGDHAMKTISVFATTVEGEDILLGRNRAKCPADLLTVRPVVGELVESYHARFEYYDVIDDRFVQTIGRQKRVDFIDDLIFPEIPFYPFDFSFIAPDVVLNLEGNFERWRLDFTLPELEAESYGSGAAFSYYQYYGERYRAPGNWSIIGSSNYPSGLVEVPGLPASVVGKFFHGRSDLAVEVYAVSVTTKSENEQITYTLRKKGKTSAPLLERQFSRRN